MLFRLPADTWELSLNLHEFFTAFLQKVLSWEKLISLLKITFIRLLKNTVHSKYYVVNVETHMYYLTGCVYGWNRCRGNKCPTAYTNRYGSIKAAAFLYFFLFLLFLCYWFCITSALISQTLLSICLHLEGSVSILVSFVKTENINNYYRKRDSEYGYNLENSNWLFFLIASWDLNQCVMWSSCLLEKY